MSGMTRITKGIIAKLLVTVCILMQVVILLPHHHHEGSDMPCVNIFHCGDNRCAHTRSHASCGCGGNHCGDLQQADGDTHNHDAEDSCVLSRTDMIRLERERFAAPVTIDVQLFAAQAIHICPIHDAEAVNCLNTITQLNSKRLRVKIPLPASYIATAIPPRAPSFTA